MTKFETLLKLSEIKGMMRLESPDASMGSISAYGEISELIDDLQHDDDECPGCGCPSHDRCHVGI